MSEGENHASQHIVWDLTDDVEPTQKYSSPVAVLEAGQKYYPSPQPQPSREPTRDPRAMAKRWVFTLNNPLPDETLDESDIQYLICGDEVGENGTPHYQGFVVFKKQQRLSSLKKMLPRAHWEVARGTDEQNVIYCSKEGKFKEFGELNSKKKDTTYFEALQANSVHEALDVIKEKRPRDYCLYGEQLERNLKKHRNKPFVHIFTKFQQPQLELNLPVLLWGPSGTGKTHFAISHFKNPLIISHIDKLKLISPDHDGLVFDDMSFKQWPKESIIHLLDTDFERDIHVRYGTVTIPAGTKKIFTHNTDNPFYNTEIDEEQQKAIERRFRRINIFNKLY